MSRSDLRSGLVILSFSRNYVDIYKFQNYKEDKVLWEEIKIDEKTAVDKYKNKIITIPNLMSMLRICMISLIAWLYLGPKNYLWSAILIVISGITDVLDGILNETT